VNRDLQRLAAWAAERAANDPDEAARPLWSQIGSEVDSYLEKTDDRPRQSGVDLFGVSS